MPPQYAAIASDTARRSIWRLPRNLAELFPDSILIAVEFLEQARADAYASLERLATLDEERVQRAKVVLTRAYSLFVPDDDFGRTDTLIETIQ